MAIALSDMSEINETVCHLNNEALLRTNQNIITNRCPYFTEEQFYNQYSVKTSEGYMEYKLLLNIFLP